MLLRNFSCTLARPRTLSFFLTVVMLSFFALPSVADAQKSSTRTVSKLGASELAQYKSRQMAAIGIQRLRKPYKSRYSNAPFGMRHVGGSALPAGARYEGVGYSSLSANQAIRNASFYGRQSMIVANVARGRDGYFATVYYR